MKKFWNEVQSENYKYFIKKIFAIVFLLAVFGGSVFAGTKNTENIKVSIKFDETQQFMNDQKNVVVLGAQVGNEFYCAKNIFKGKWSEEQGGSLSCIQGNGEILTGIIPKGSTQKIIFKGGRWSGGTLISYNGKQRHLNTYIYGEGQDVSMNLSKINVFHGILVGAIVFIGLTLLGSILFLITNVGAICWKEIEYRKIFLIISGLILTIILSGISFDLKWSYFAALGSLPIYYYLLFRISMRKEKIEKYNESIFGKIFIFVVCMIGIIWSRGSCVFNYFSGIVTLQKECVVLAFVLIMPIIWYLIGLWYDCVKKIAIQFQNEMDGFEKKYFWGANVLLIIILALLYTHTSAFSNGLIRSSDGSIQRQYADIIYGYDHSWLQDYFPTMDGHIFSIKHPFIYVFFFIPGWIGNILNRVLGNMFPQIYGFYWAMLCAQCMFLSAIIMKRLTQNKQVAIIYSLTFFFLIMCFGAEQYQISVFLILFCAYEFIKSGKVQKGLLLAMSGGTITSGHLVPVLIKYDNFSQFVKELIRYCIYFISTCCMTGTIYMLSPEQFKGLLQPFGLKYSWGDKIKVLTNFVVWNFVSPEANEIVSQTGNPVYTSSLPVKISIVGLLLALVCIFVIIKRMYQKEWDNLIKISAFSFGFSIVLIMGGILQLDEAWIYCILFSWAYVILLHDFFSHLFKKNLVVVYNCIIVVLLLVNLNSLAEVFEFCVKNYSGLG